MNKKEALQELKDFKNKSWDGMPEEVIDIAIEALEHDILKGCTHQKVDREIFKEIMTDAEKMRAFVHLQSAITNFIAIIGDIDIQIDLQPKKEV